MGRGKGWRTTSREKHWCRDNDKVIKRTCSGTEDTDGQYHLEEQAMIARTGPQPGWLHKGRDTKTYHRMRHCNYSGHLTYQKEVKRNRERTQRKNHHLQVKMVRMKKTSSKRGPQEKEPPQSAWRMTRIEQAAREAKSTFLTKTDTKGKKIIKIWEGEINNARRGKSWSTLTQEAGGIRDPGATQPRLTLYHRMVEEAWRTKMLIGKMCADRGETNRMETKEQKKERTGILNRLSNLEAGVKRLVEDQKRQQEKLERMAGQFHLYLRYVHHIDITPADRNGTPTCIRKLRLVEQREEDTTQQEGDEEHPINLD
jgi:hypothetical protein